MALFREAAPLRTGMLAAVGREVASVGIFVAYLAQHGE